MRSQFPVLDFRKTIDDIVFWIEEVSRIRSSDVDDYAVQVRENPRIFSAPTSSTDIKGTEKVGDLAADASYFYVVVDNGGDLEWRRVAISSF